MTPRKERIVPTRCKEVIGQAAYLDAAGVVREDFELRGRIADRFEPEAIKVPNLNHPYIGINTAVFQQQRQSDEVGGVLGRVVAADGAIGEGAGEGARVGDVEEVRDVEGRGGQAVEDADRPALLGEAPVPGADVALCVWAHVRVAGVPEEESSNESTCSDPRRSLHIGEILSAMISSRGFPGKES